MTKSLVPVSFKLKKMNVTLPLYVHTFHDSKGTHRRGTAVILISPLNGNIFLGTSFCSPLDEWNGKVGEMKAQGRAIQALCNNRPAYSINPSSFDPNDTLLLRAIDRGLAAELFEARKRLAETHLKMKGLLK